MMQDSYSELMQKYSQFESGQAIDPLWADAEVEDEEAKMAEEKTPWMQKDRY